MKDAGDVPGETGMEYHKWRVQYDKIRYASFCSSLEAYPKSQRQAWPLALVCSVGLSLKDEGTDFQSLVDSNLSHDTRTKFLSTLVSIMLTF